MSRPLYLFLFLLVLPAAQLSAQTSFTLRLLDANTGAPIVDAFVFFDGSSAGDISNKEGEVTLQKEPYLDLVISHLSYATKVLTPEKVGALRQNTDLRLQPTAVQIAEVTVSSVSNIKKRKRWLKRFTSAFLGPARDRKGVEIQNPDVLLFQESNNGLRAIARSRLEIKNKALGYNLSFLLDTFLLRPNNEVLYGGKAFFRDNSPASPQRANAWKQNRSRSFKQSKRYFFQQLVRGQLDEDRFDVGESKFDKSFELLSFSSESITDLHWGRGELADTLYYPGYFSVLDRTVITRWTNKSSAGGVVAAEYATTFMRSRSGRFIISPGGLLLNNQEIEEIGYWANQRVARLLPDTYGRLPPTKVTENLPAGATMAQTLTALTNYLKSYRQEKVYLHFDKSYYQLGEKIWFRAYLLDAITQQMETGSAVVHVELISPNGDVIRSLALHRKQGLFGDFTLTKDDPTGVYTVRAYSDYMRNQTAGYFFQQTLPVYDPAAVEDGILTGVQWQPGLTNQSIKPEQPFTLKFSPEGGRLVAGVTNKVVLQALDAQGQALRLKGTIVGPDKNSSANWSAEYAGFGMFRFTPVAGSTYFAETKYQGQTYRIALPKVNSGPALQVNNLLEEDVLVKVAAEKPTNLTGTYLIGYVRGNIFYESQELVAGEEMAIPRAQIPGGLACFALFNEVGNLIGERTFFNDQWPAQTSLSVSMPYAFIRPRQQATVVLRWADSLQQQGATLSVAVTDKRFVNTKSVPGIGTYLSLAAELPAPLAQFAGEASAQQRRFLRDLQLISTPWQRFPWAKLTDGPPDTLAYHPETTTKLKGYITRAGKPDKRIQAEVVLIALHPQPMVKKILTDENGAFTFDNLPYLDSVNYLLQAAESSPGKFKEDIPVLTGKNRKLKINLLTSRTPAPLASRKVAVSARLPEDKLSALQGLANTSINTDSLAGVDWAVDLESVTVTSKRAVDSRNLDVFDFNKLDWIPPQQSLYSLLSTLKPGYRFYREELRDGVYARVNNGQGKYIRLPVTFTINGFGASWARFNALTADMIDYLVIMPTSIMVTARPAPRSEATSTTPGTLRVKTEGFYPGAPFPDQLYGPQNPEPTTRQTLSWVPNLRLDAGASASLSFFAADNPGEYEVRIEGLTDAGEPILQTFTVRVQE